MMEICKDIVFGEMTYNHRWYKQTKISMFGKEWTIKVVAKAYSGKSITEDQQKAYAEFLENEKKMVSCVEKQLMEYVNTNLYELAVYWIGVRKINNIEELAQMVCPKTLLFKQDGTTIVLFDCIWDEENGIAVKLVPEVAVGRQDLFL